MPRVIIEIKGGMVVAVYSNTEIDIGVLDRDVDGESDQRLKYNKELEKESKKLNNYFS